MFVACILKAFASLINCIPSRTFHSDMIALHVSAPLVAVRRTTIFPTDRRRKSTATAGGATVRTAGDQGVEEISSTQVTKIRAEHIMPCPLCQSRTTQVLRRHRSWPIIYIFYLSDTTEQLLWSLRQAPFNLEGCRAADCVG